MGRVYFVSIVFVVMTYCFVLYTCHVNKISLTYLYDDVHEGI